MKVKKIKFEIKRLSFLLLLVAFFYILFRLRSSVLGERHYAFMVWNLYLAWIPYGISCVMLLISRYTQSKWWTLSLLPLGALWLIFFPNAPYMITTYAHFSWVGFLRYDGVMAFALQPWYDFVLFNSAIWSGVLAGLASLQITHNIVEKHFGKIAGWATVVIVNFLSSWAIYLGRFIRLNSWYLFRNPTILLPYILLCRDRMLFIFLLAVFLVLMYTAVYSFGKREGQQPSSKDTGL